MNILNKSKWKFEDRVDGWPPSVVRRMGDGMVNIDCHYPVDLRLVGEPSFCLSTINATESTEEVVAVVWFYRLVDHSSRSHETKMCIIRLWGKVLNTFGVTCTSMFLLWNCVVEDPPVAILLMIMVSYQYW